MGTESRRIYPRRRQRFLLSRGEEKGSIESKEKISGAKSTLRPEELHWIEVILSALAGECGRGDRGTRQRVAAL